MTISLICAASQNGVIGIDNKLPWKLPADLKRFKALTMGHHVVMGRKTYESIGKPLPGRTNVIITGSTDFRAEGCLIASSPQEALDLCRAEQEIFVIGGGSVYRQFLEVAQRVYLTIIHTDFEGDTFLFDLDPAQWQETSRAESGSAADSPYAYSFITFERIPQRSPT
jgi:dihydrofolate reductase